MEAREELADRVPQLGIVGTDEPHVDVPLGHLRLASVLCAHARVLCAHARVLCARARRDEQDRERGDEHDRSRGREHQRTLGPPRRDCACAA